MIRYAINTMYVLLAGSHIPMMKLLLPVLASLTLLGVGANLYSDDKPKDAPQKAGETYLIPYRLSDVKHVVIRVKINGKGPFNFIVDTGAPAVYLGNEIAKKLGIEPKEEGFWETFDAIEVEGGLKINKLKVRVEEPFQLVGINKMNAAGMRYHGVMGYAVLAQFQIEYDFTEPHMKWTRLDWKPPPPVGMGSLSAGASANMKAMVGLSMFATSLMPKKVDPTLVYRGLMGIELTDKDGKLLISSVLPNTPASRAELKPDDQIITCNGKTVNTTAELQKLAATIGSDKEVTFEISRGGEKQTIKLTTSRGF